MGQKKAVHITSLNISHAQFHFVSFVFVNVSLSFWKRFVPPLTLQLYIYIYVTGKKISLSIIFNYIQNNTKDFFK